MKKVIERSMIVPNMHLLVVEAPEIASKVKPGQFVIVRGGDEGERIPLSRPITITEKGIVSIVFGSWGLDGGSRAAQRRDAVATAPAPWATRQPLIHS